MALAALQLAAIPVAAGLLAGSGAIATFVSAPSNASVSVAATPARQAGVPCSAQTWPYIDQKCMPSAVDRKRTVRLVSAPRNGEASEASENAAVSSTGSAAAARAAEPSLTTSDTVLRQPQPQASRGPQPEPQASKPRTKRGETTRRQRDRRWAAQSYQVPSEFQDRGGRAVIVVRPLRLEAFR
jgi:hypothetical protein